MPWRNLPTDWLHSDAWKAVITFIGALLTAGIGVMARIADEVKTGGRPRFFSRHLWLEVPIWLMVAIMVVAVTAFYDLPGPVSGGVGVFFGYLGPKVVDALVSSRLGK